MVGGRQFKRLCKDHATVEIKETKAKDKRVVLDMLKGAVYVEGTAVQIRIDPYIFRDQQTNEEVARYYVLHAQGGRLIQALGISETNAPSDRESFKERLNITVVN